MTSSDAVSVGFLAGGLMLIGGHSIFMALKRHRQARDIENHPMAKTETAAQGLTEFQGFAWGQSPGPINDRGYELIYYSFQLQKLVTEGTGKQRKTTWKTIFSKGFFQPFYLLDATGLVLINPKGADIHFKDKRTQTWISLSAAEQKHFQSHVIDRDVAGFPPSTFFFGLFSAKFRVIQSEVREGAPIYVKGDFRTERSDKGELALVRRPGLTAFYDRFFDFQSRSIKNVNHLLDLNKDGKITHRELNQGYTQFARFTRTKSKDEGFAVDEREFKVHGMIGSSKDHQLVLADTHQEQFLRDLKKGGIFHLAGGALLITLGAAAFIFLLGRN